jgi:hypothetical protein
VGPRFSAPVQTGPGAHPSFCARGTGCFPGVESDRGVTLIPRPVLVPWSKKQSSAIPLLSRTDLVTRKKGIYNLHTDVMHKFLIYLSIYFCLKCFGLSFSPSSEAGVQLRQWFKSVGYGVSARSVTAYPGHLNHCRSCTPAAEDGLKESPKHLRQKEIINKLRTCALRWSLYSFIPKCTVLTK